MSIYLIFRLKTSILVLFINSEVNQYLSIKPNKSNVFIPIFNACMIDIPPQVEKYSSKEYSLSNNSNEKQLSSYVFAWNHYIPEVLYLIRPGVYVILLFSFKDTPYVSLVASALIDGAILLTQRYNTLSSFSTKRIYSHEREYRLMRLYFYLMREPIYSKITLKVITKIASVFPSFIQSFLINILVYYRKISFIA